MRGGANLLGFRTPALLCEFPSGPYPRLYSVSPVRRAASSQVRLTQAGSMAQGRTP